MWESNARFIVCTCSSCQYISVVNESCGRAMRDLLFVPVLHDGVFKLQEPGNEELTRIFVQKER